MTSQLPKIIPQSHAELLLTMRLSIEKAYEEKDNMFIQNFRHGLSTKEVENEHKELVKSGRFKSQWVEYGNKLRALVNYDRLARRHRVHGTVHFYPIVSDEDGLITHLNCDCPRK